MFFLSEFEMNKLETNSTCEQIFSMMINIYSNIHSNIHSLNKDDNTFLMMMTIHFK